MLSNRNRAYSTWLGAGRPEDPVRFKTAQRTAHKAIKEARNRDMQCCKRGNISSHVVTIYDENDISCVIISIQHQRSRRHFVKVLIVVNQYDDGELALVRQRDMTTYFPW